MKIYYHYKHNLMRNYLNYNMVVESQKNLTKMYQPLCATRNAPVMFDGQNQI